MKSNLSRREWFRSALAASAGIPLSLTLVQDLMAAPASRAEWEYWGTFKAGGKQLIRLGSNENPYGPSQKAREAIKASVSEGNRYAFEVIDEFRLMLANKEGVPADHQLDPQAPHSDDPCSGLGARRDFRVVAAHEDELHR